MEQWKWCDPQHEHVFTIFYSMDPAQEKLEKVDAESFIRRLINKQLRIHTTDSRMFVGVFKCTDPVSYSLPI